VEADVTDLRRNSICVILVALLSLFLVLQSSGPVYAWNFSVNVEPEVRYAFPGQTVSYTVYVGLVTGPAAVVNLLVSPYSIELNGLSFSFSPSSSGTPPFTRTLYVTVSTGKAAGTYTIPTRFRWRASTLQSASERTVSNLWFSRLRLLQIGPSPTQQ